MQKLHRLNLPSDYLAAPALLVALLLCSAAWAHEGEGEHSHGDAQPQSDGKSAEEHDGGAGHAGAGHAAAGHAAAGPHDAGAHSTGHEAAPPNPLIVDPDLAIFTVLMFFFTMVVLNKFAWGPILVSLQKREEGIAHDLEVAQRQQEEAERLEREYARELEHAAERVRERLEQARKEAEAAKAELLASTRGEVQQALEGQLAEVSAAKEQALRQVGRSSSEFAVQLAGRITDKQVRLSDHQDTIAEVTQQMSRKIS